MGSCAGKRKLTGRVKAWMSAYEGAANMNATEAARLAGFRHPERAGHQIKVRWAEEVEKIELRVADKFKLSDKDLDEIPATIARNSHESAQNRLKAVELVARMKGKLNDKINLNVSRSDIQKQLDEALMSLAQMNQGKKQRSDAELTELLDPLTEPDVRDHTIRSLTGTPEDPTKDS